MSNKQLLQKRIYAFTVDLACIAFIQKSLLSSFLLFIKQSNFFSQFTLNTKLIAPLDTLLLTIVVISYFTLAYYLFNGKTLGKFLFNLRVISKNHHHFTFTDAFIRANGYFFCLLTFNILFLLPFINKKAEGIPDWLSNSFVTHSGNQVQSIKTPPILLDILPAQPNSISLSYNEDDQEKQYFNQAA